MMSLKLTDQLQFDINRPNFSTTPMHFYLPPRESDEIKKLKILQIIIIISFFANVRIILTEGCCHRTRTTYDVDRLRVDAVRADSKRVTPTCRLMPGASHNNNTVRHFQ